MAFIKSIANPKSDKEAAEFVRRIDDLLEEESSRTGRPRYEWAADTLESIKETVAKTGRVTEAQERAVNNIESARRSY